MSKKQITLYALLSFSLFIGFLIARVPAELVFYFITKQVPVISASQVRGSFWNGKAANISIDYAGTVISLGQSAWEFKPLSLLAGKLAVTLNCVNGEQKIIGDYAFGLNKSISMKDAEIALDTQWIARFYPYPGKLSGMVDVVISEFSFADNQIKQLQASATLQNAIYTLTAPVVLGTYGAKISLDKNTITADLTDVDAPLTFTGTATITTDSKAYTLEAKVLPKANADPLIVQSLMGMSQLQATPQIVKYFEADGTYTISYANTL